MAARKKKVQSKATEDEAVEVYVARRTSEGWVYERGVAPRSSISVGHQSGPHSIDVVLAMLDRDVASRAAGGRHGA